jgi:hypothetical protein
VRRRNSAPILPQITGLPNPFTAVAAEGGSGLITFRLTAERNNLTFTCQEIQTFE